MNNIHKHRSAENGTPINKSKGRRTALLLAAVILAASFPMVLMTSEYGYSSGAEETFEKDGLKYKVLSGDATVEVTGFVDGTTPIDITIPETVTDSSNIYTVTNIGDDAFKDCKSLESVTILDSVTSIGSSAFRKCINLESIDLGSVTTIKGWAFEGCTSLESIDLSSVISIYHSVFWGCTKFVSVTIPESVTGMGNEAFRGCTELTDVKFESNTAIGDGAFYGCTKLKNIDLGPVKKINNNAFRYCTSLTSITIPSSVTYIGDNVFGGTILTSITIPSSVTYIGKNVFEGCTELKVAVLPSSLIFEDNVFPTETILLMNDNDDVIVYASMNGENIEMTIDLGEGRILDSVTVTDMDDTAVSVTPSEDIWVFEPEGVKEFKLNIVVVPDGANFKDGGLWYKINEENASEVLVLCAVDANSSSINIPSTVTNDGNTYAVTYIGRDAFRDCTSLVSVTIPSSVTYIDHSAFRNSNLGSITIPESVTYIGQNAFRDCSELTDVKFESSTIIDGWAFDNCTKLTNIDLGSVTNIGGNAFRDCKSLVSVTIPESVTYIGNNAFENCTSLKSITIPLTVTSIRENAFKGCTDIIVIVPTSFPSGNWMSSVAFLLKTDSTNIISASFNEGKIEMIIGPGKGKIVDTVTVTDDNDENVIVTRSGDKWIFDTESRTEFVLEIVTSDVPDEGDDGFWTTTNIVIVGAVAAAAILGLLYVFVIRRP